MDRPKGKRGGKRPGAGRPYGSREALSRAENSAVRAAKIRIPKDCHPEAEEVAHRAFDRIVAIMDGKFVDTSKASLQLKAAASAREEICGSPKQQVALTDGEGGPLQITVNKLPPEDED